MADRPQWAPPGVDIEHPSVARVYDYYLGGSHNFESDRAFAQKVLAALPEIPVVARDNRGFLRRVVRHLCAMHEGLVQTNKGGVLSSCQAAAAHSSHADPGPRANLPPKEEKEPGYEACSAATSPRDHDHDLLRRSIQTPSAPSR